MLFIEIDGDFENEKDAGYWQGITTAVRRAEEKLSAAVDGGALVARTPVMGPKGKIGHAEVAHLSPEELTRRYVAGQVNRHLDVDPDTGEVVLDLYI